MRCKMIRVLVVLVILSLPLGACDLEILETRSSQSLTAQAEAANQVRYNLAIAATQTYQAALALTPPTPSHTPIPSACAPAEPQQVNLTPLGGREGTAIYYPPLPPGAPAAVIFGNNITASMGIAAWFQNRGNYDFSSNPGAWQPGSSFLWAALVPRIIFSGDAKEPFLDAEAAMLTAIEQPCVNPAAILSMGIGEGGIAAVYSCWQLNKQFPGACPAALVVSPGGYYEDEFEFFASELNQANPEAKVFCASSPGQSDICNDLSAQSNAHMVQIPGTDFIVSEEFYHVLEKEGFWAIFGVLGEDPE